MLFFKLLTPPGLNILLLLAALGVHNTYRWLSIALISTSVFLLSVFSIPLIAQSLYESHQSYPTFKWDSTAPPKAKAIVILGHGRTRVAPEYDDINTVGALTLERLRYGAYLHKKLELPVLVSGGRDAFTASPEAVLANHVMAEEFDVAPHWLETRGETLEEKAALSVELLSENNIDSILLICRQSDMDRAILAFQQLGLEVQAAPISRASPLEPLDIKGRWLPTATALHVSQEAMLKHIQSVVGY